MKLISSIMLLTCLYTGHVSATPVTDTTIVHVQDGKLDEWNQSRFSMDNDTKISYAIDNDDKYLYIGLQIPEMATQMKMMRTGMTVYVDLKGKKKTGRGIEFPVTPDKGQGFAPTEGNARPARNEADVQDPSERQATRIMMRNGMAIRQLNTIRLTGFSEGDDSQQILNVPGSVQVAYKCDTTEAMEIEYMIPLSLLGGSEQVSGKQISIGCRIHAMEMPAGGFGGGAQGGMGGMRGGGGRGMGGSRGLGSGMSTGMSRETMMREQSFWAKYIFSVH